MPAVNRVACEEVVVEWAGAGDTAGQGWVRDSGAMKGAHLLVEWVSTEPGGMGGRLCRWRARKQHRGRRHLSNYREAE